MTPFVGVSEKLLTEEQLRTLLQQPITSPSYYFLRWSHKVSGIVKELPDDFPSPEGQMFNCELELRWKKQGQKFSVLLLSTIGEKPGFESVGQDWQVREREVAIYLTKPVGFL
jgi:hypothetical protein